MYVAHTRRPRRALVVALITSLALTACNEEPLNAPSRERRFVPRFSGGSPGACCYVATNGASSGPGTKASPWNLTYAAGGAGGSITAGTTVWLRGGTYLGNFVFTAGGSSGSPVVFRQHPGERAVIDRNGGITNDSTVASLSTIKVTANYVELWDLEITNSNTSRIAPDTVVRQHLHDWRPHGIYNQGNGTRFVNLVIHDAGVAFYSDPGKTGVVVSGCVIYNNGFDGPTVFPPNGVRRGHGHGLYLANNTSGSMSAYDNIIFNQFGYGLHVYRDTGQNANITASYNIAFNNGNISAYGAYPNLANAGQNVPTSLTFQNNVLYFSASHDGLGYSSNLRLDTATSSASGYNYVVGPGGIVGGGGWSGTGNDSYASSEPGSPWAMARRTAADSERIHVVIIQSGTGSYNYTLPSGLINSGDRYDVYNAQDTSRTIIATGTYTGASITFPMTAVTPPPVRGGSPISPIQTGQKFNAFVLLRTPPYLPDSMRVHGAMTYSGTSTTVTPVLYGTPPNQQQLCAYQPQVHGGHGYSAFLYRKLKIGYDSVPLDFEVALPTPNGTRKFWIRATLGAQSRTSDTLTITADTTSGYPLCLL